ncbi:hypothetical protein KCU90_g111, partial [Aureobasidium melanogenum]
MFAAPKPETTIAAAILVLSFEVLVKVCSAEFGVLSLVAASFFRASDLHGMWHMDLGGVLNLAVVECVLGRVDSLVVLETVCSACEPARLMLLFVERWHAACNRSGVDTLVDDLTSLRMLIFRNWGTCTCESWCVLAVLRPIQFSHLLLLSFTTTERLPRSQKVVSANAQGYPRYMPELSDISSPTVIKLTFGL